MSAHAPISAGARASDAASGTGGWAQTRRRLAYVATFARPYRGRFAMTILTNVAMTLFALAIPYFFKHAIDAMNTGDSATVQRYVGLALAAAVLAWISAAGNFLFSVVGIRMLNDLRVALFGHVQRQGLDFFHNERTGRVISRLTNDVDAIENMLTDGVYMVFNALLSLIGIEIFLFVLDWRLALATNAIFPVMLVATIAFRYYSSRAYRLTRERMALVTAHLQESISGMRIVQAFAAEHRVADDFEQTTEHYRRANMQTIYLSASYFPAIEWLSVIGTGIVLWYGGYLQAQEAVTLGVLFAYLAYLNDFFDPIQQLSQFYNSFLSAMAALDKIMDVMETEPTIQDSPQARTLSAVRGDIRFDGVHFSYAESMPEVLHDVSFDVHAGQTIALVGHTGAGKSTIVKLLARFYDPTAGRILLDGVDIRDLRASWFRSILGIVPQEGFLFSSTVAENIRFSRPDAPDDDVERAARTVGAHELISQLEDGYDTHVGERGNRLSAGQRQLVAFARALLANPSLLVLDEATSSVDVATEQRLEHGLRALVAGRTAFIVAHRLSTIRSADSIFVVDRGRIVERGTHDELLSRGGQYADLYGSWTGAPQTIDEQLAPSRPSGSDATPAL